MPKSLSEKELMVANENKLAKLSRRNFLGYAGATTGVLLGLSSCTRDVLMPNSPNSPTSVNASVDLGSGDIGILNYAYALEQLEAAFYTMVIATPFAGLGTIEGMRLKEIRDHEIAHREFFKTALAGNAITTLEFDFSSVNFASKESVLGTAKAFEDLGVSAYNGAGRLLMNPDFLVLAGKIVSVEARHAAYLRELVALNSFADDSIVDPMGLDVTRKPTEVLSIASKYIKTEIKATNLPTY